MSDCVKSLPDIQEGDKCLLAMLTLVLYGLLENKSRMKAAKLGAETTLKRVGREWWVKGSEVKEYQSLKDLADVG